MEAALRLGPEPAQHDRLDAPVWVLLHDVRVAEDSGRDLAIDGALPVDRLGASEEERASVARQIRLVRPTIGGDADVLAVAEHIDVAAQRERDRSGGLR